MKIFKPDFIETEQVNILYPKKENIDAYTTKSLSFYTVTTLFSLIDYSSCIKFSKKMAENFINDNTVFLSNLKNLGNENIENIWDIVNNFLSLNSLGKSQIEISIDSQRIVIYNNDSPFANSLYKITNQKTCEFLLNLYSHIISNIFDTEVKFKEMECKNEKHEGFCILKMV